MKFKAALLAVGIVAILPGVTLAQTRNENVESTCQSTGSGMDPRCVGDTQPGTISDKTTAREQNAIERNPSSPVVAPMDRRGNMER